MRFRTKQMKKFGNFPSFQILYFFLFEFFFLFLLLLIVLLSVFVFRDFFAWLRKHIFFRIFLKGKLFKKKLRESPLFFVINFWESGFLCYFFGVNLKFCLRKSEKFVEAEKSNLRELEM